MSEQPKPFQREPLVQTCKVFFGVLAAISIWVLAILAAHYFWGEGGVVATILAPLGLIVLFVIFMATYEHFEMEYMRKEHDPHRFVDSE